MFKALRNLSPMASMLVKVVPTCFVVGFCMELFMVKTGFYDVATRKAAERIAQRQIDDEQRAQRLKELGIKFQENVALSMQQHDADDEPATYAVCMTTIPPRFTSIHHTLRSWLQQQDIQPACLAVFVPKVYRRFKRRSHNDTATSIVTTAHLLERSIRENAPDLAAHLDSSRIHVVPVETDYGPITKLTGLLHHYSSACARQQQQLRRPIDFWVFGDDDVAYTPQTLLRYSLRMLLPPPGMQPAQLVRTALTHFSEDVRLVVKLAHEGHAPRPVRHLQGVDTVLLPVALLEAQRAEGHVLHPAVFVDLLESAVLSKCPDAFYQDDYVIALLLNLGGVEVLSAWNNDHVAKHIEGVSKDNSQMHMKASVYEREEATKACLAKEADNIHRQRVGLTAAQRRSDQGL